MFLNFRAPTTKQAVLECLTAEVQADLLNDTSTPRVSLECRSELKFQLLQKHANIRLNPKVVSAHYPANILAHLPDDFCFITIICVPVPTS